MAFGVIYVITNLLDGMQYVGQTTRSIEQRFKEHMKAKSYIGSAIREVGTENFSIEIIAECASKEELNAKEIFFIEEFDCMAPNGYNLTEGGQYCPLGSMNIHDVTDTKTGEVISHHEYVGTQNGKNWWIMYRTTMAFIASGELTYSAVRVYMHITARADWRGVLSTTQTAIAKEIGISRQAVNKAIEELKHYDLIREAKENGQTVYIVNPAYATLGKDKKRRLAVFNEIPCAENYIKIDSEEYISATL